MTKIQKILLIISISILVVAKASLAQNNNNIIQQFSTLSNAHFIAKPYIQSLQKTKSPAATQKNENKLVQLILPVVDLDSGSITIDGQTLNEGGLGFRIYFIEGIKNNTWQTNTKNYNNTLVDIVDIGLTITKKDTTLTLYYYSKTKKLIGSTLFVKSNEAFATNQQTAYMQYLINKTLFTGTWAGNGFNLQFTNQGVVQGFKDAINYEIDFYIQNTTGQNSKKYNKITFTNPANQTSTFLWLMVANKLTIYKFIETYNNGFKVGKLLYTFFKYK